MIKNTQLLIAPLLLLLGSCASGLFKDEKPSIKDSVKVEKYTRIQQDIVDNRIPSCDSCILGSADGTSLKKENKKVYFLYGAEHLNLKNNYFDIPVVYNDATKKWIKYFTGRGKKVYHRYAERSGRYAPVFSKILDDNGLPRDLIYLSMAESGFQNNAKSWAKAVGPWQFMKATGSRYGLEINWYKDERRDPIKATAAAARYLKDLYEMFGAWELACAGYNAGEGKIKRAIRRYGTKSFWKIRKGRYLRRETKDYVPKIMALAIIGKNLESFGFTDVKFAQPLDFEIINVKENTDLYNIADVLDINFDEVKKYNSELVRWQTPYRGGDYQLRVPVGKKKAWDKLKDKEKVIAKNYKPYSLRGYASLKHVSRKFKIPVSVLSELNGFSGGKKLFPKTPILLPFRTNHHIKDRLYSDLYEKPRKSVVRRRTYRRWINRGYKKGTQISSPSEYYTVRRGDTLWGVAKKTGVSINTIIRSNYALVKRRMILPGDKLAIR